jgi:hypothetical protein
MASRQVQSGYEMVVPPAVLGRQHLRIDAGAGAEDTAYPVANGDFPLTDL